MVLNANELNPLISLEDPALTVDRVVEYLESVSADMAAAGVSASWSVSLGVASAALRHAEQRLIDCRQIGTEGGAAVVRVVGKH